MSIITDREIWITHDDDLWVTRDVDIWIPDTTIVPGRISYVIIDRNLYFECDTRNLSFEIPSRQTYFATNDTKKTFFVAQKREQTINTNMRTI